ncbi:MAG: hypothetical protein IPH43_07900 [Xanthomonadales bacterium]|uniref:hypothetical protein n=2 Tax=Dokdonella sp. TaxID=2291710 RepID=UPI002B549D34|nr:hypothetical protein [Xanthomonadales bacterium]HQX64976.1 hypothetical protein [Dokdonella sp.]MBK7012591.1 hypothetical protein [Xanthomonadales bacterium]MBK7210604.1 hypothetical protein [Xanthomonadales bacterium]MBL0223187.1 hypothetical protein [Xanthomonadales bacterium]
MPARCRNGGWLINHPRHEETRMLFTTSQPITQSMAIAITHAIQELDADATVRAEMSSQSILIDGDVTVDQAKAALAKAHCEYVTLEQPAEPVHIQGGHTCCGHCA